MDLEQKVKNVDFLMSTNTSLSLEGACRLCGITEKEYWQVKDKSKIDVPDFLQDLVDGKFGKK